MAIINGIVQAPCNRNANIGKTAREVALYQVNDMYRVITSLKNVFVPLVEAIQAKATEIQAAEAAGQDTSSLRADLLVLLCQQNTAPNGTEMNIIEAVSYYLTNTEMVLDMMDIGVLQDFSNIADVFTPIFGADTTSAVTNITNSIAVIQTLQSAVSSTVLLPVARALGDISTSIQGVSGGMNLV